MTSPRPPRRAHDAYILGRAFPAAGAVRRRRRRATPLLGIMVRDQIAEARLEWPDLDFIFRWPKNRKLRLGYLSARFPRACDGAVDGGVVRVP